MAQTTLLYVNGRQNPHERMAELTTAISENYKIVVLGNSLPMWVSSIACEVVECDLHDTSAVIKIVKKLHLNYDFKGIICWSETDVPLRNLLSKSLGLPGMAQEDVKCCRDKVSMKQRLNQQSNLLPKWKSVSSLESAQNAALEIGFPLILKPASGSGSKGIFKINKMEHLIDACSELNKITRPEFDAVFERFGSEWIIEEYVDGPEFSVDGYVHRGNIYITGITDYKSDTENFIEHRHIFPSALPSHQQQDICKNAREIIGLLNIQASNFHLEGKYSTQGFKFIECAARPAGGYISTHLLQYATQNQHLKNYLRVCQDLSPLPNPEITEYIGVKYLFAHKSGLYRGCENFEYILNNPFIKHVYLHFQPGHKILLPPNNYNDFRLGVIIATHKNYDIVAQTLEKAASEIRFHIE